MSTRSVEVEITEDIESLSGKAAEFVVRCIVDHVRLEERVAVALSGGTTPQGVYERLGSENFRNRIPWSRVHLFWGDERCVPPDNPESNYLAAYKTLISRVPIPPENVHRIPGEKDPEKAAEDYERTLRDFFRSSSGEWPTFDLVLLGIGSDGHTASLFPGSLALQEKKRWVAASCIEKLKSYRLTLTLPVFNHTRQVVFLAAGKEKAAVLKGMQTMGSKPARFPFQLIRPEDGRMKFFLDKAAASLIGQKNGS